jgi:hypothetical protein
LDNNLTEIVHNIVSNDWFLLFASLTSIVSFFMALFAVKKVNSFSKITSSIKNSEEVAVKSKTSNLTLEDSIQESKKVTIDV